ncbi:TauD/TfdA dioxygenase family protein [Saccharothrix tamanrassetensis]|uniref:TauD/TfdA dioxygenase family protein n=1 Tax=Saccharothrix tamanrassetensis TaxID=1051531 RepID=UPI00161FDBC8|nr:TauD/TfdA family dioxygenase [Saccharothrix tamanrassetensis]
MTGHIGADVSGVDISRPLDAESVGLIREALFEYKVVFFRDQRLDHASQIAFGRQFGELTYAHPHDDTPPGGFPEIFTIDPRRYEERYGPGFEQQVRRRQYSYFSGWHTDVTAAVNPPAGSILRAEVVPERGGDTTWTNLVARLPGPVRAAEVLRGRSAGGAPLRRRGQAHRRRRLRQAGQRQPAGRRAPGGPRAPVTGERALFVNPGFTSHVVDVSPRESKAVLDLLYAEITRPEYTVRFRWEPGSVAFWDNRATAHLAPRDLAHLDVERRLHRVTLIGDVPVGPDGRHSELVAGKPFTSEHTVKVD